jgi:hypothetical protein
MRAVPAAKPRQPVSRRAADRRHQKARCVAGQAAI